MADIRENLIDILRKTRYEYRRYIGMKDMEKRMAKTEEEFLSIDDSILGEIPFCADYLLSNGVTVQEWIPVTERLPEKKGTFLVCTKNDFYGTKNIAKVRFSNGEWHGTGGIWSNVTHWMPMPEPPKGE